MGYQLNLYLLRMAAEDGAQQAVSAEITRQLATQGIAVTNVSTALDIKIVDRDVLVNNEPVCWTEEVL